VSVASSRCESSTVKGLPCTRACLPPRLLFELLDPVCSAVDDQYLPFNLRPNVLVRRHSHLLGKTEGHPIQSACLRCAEEFYGNASGPLPRLRFDLASGLIRFALFADPVPS
jgi:hypothetical protein